MVVVVVVVVGNRRSRGGETNNAFASAPVCSLSAGRRLFVYVT